MSAITGIFYRDGDSVERQHLEKMLDILAHRGSDAVGIWSEEEIGLGHRLLWTTPESLIESFPLVNQTGNFILTADARIDNRDELIAALAIKDRPAEKITDSQLILSAYEQWGEDCPQKLLGDFAFAIWNKHQQTLFCARDHFGVRSFYYYLSERLFTFSTEIKALFCVPEVPQKFNEIRVAEYLASVERDSISTFYQNIFRLPPAHSMTISREKVEIRSYWSLNPNYELKLGSNQEYAEAFLEVFTEAVRCRLRSAFPVGSMLSGGMDSSSVTCMARKLLQENGQQSLPTFSAVFDKTPECDESFYQNAVIAQGNLQPNRIPANDISPLVDIEQFLWHHEQPNSGGNAYIAWCAHKLACEQGIRIMLDGFDGDTTISHGRKYLIELAHKKRWLTLLVEMKAYGERFNLPWKKPFYNWVLQYGIHPEIAKYQTLKKIVKAYRQIKNKSVPQSNSSSSSSWSKIINSDFVKQINLAQIQQTSYQLEAKTEREFHYKMISWPLMPDVLESVSKACAAWSIELRHPFWDMRLVEFCLSLPPQQKMSRGWTRMIVRRSMDGILPQEVQWRIGKAELASSFNRGLVEFETERLERIFSQPSEVMDKYLDTKVLRQVYTDFISGQFKPGEDWEMWKGISLALWLEQKDFL